MAQRGIRLHREVGVDIYYFAFNMDDPTFGGFSNPTALLAGDLAGYRLPGYDRSAHQGPGQRAESLLPPGLFWLRSAFSQSVSPV